MRNRYRLTIFVILLLASSSSIFLHSLFLRQERLKLIDQQVRDTATALVDSKLAQLRQIDFDEVDDIISEELGESRIGKFFIIRNSKGEIVFESAGARVLPLQDIPQKDQWYSLNLNDKFVRVLNLKLPRIDDRTMQVGLVIDQQIVNPTYFSNSSYLFFVLILGIGLIAAYLSTSFLLKPLVLLREFLDDIRSNPEYSSNLPKVPVETHKYTSTKSDDEFTALVKIFDELTEKINKNYASFKQWTYQMAHELKTPLSVVLFEVEDQYKKAGVTAEQDQVAVIEIKKTSDIINSFLGWSELENSKKKPQLFANEVGSLVKEVSFRFYKTQIKRLNIKVSSHLIVAADTQHISQLITNLVGNALKYSPADKEVEVTVNEHSLLIKDHGYGLPSDVENRIGEPFNKGDSGFKVNGQGLGLAWAMAICRLYGWKLEFNTSKNGTTAAVMFNEKN